MPVATKVAESTSKNFRQNLDDLDTIAKKIDKLKEKLEKSLT